MRSLQISIPGKTFLAGEYLALKGLGALVFATNPRFKTQVRELPSGSVPTASPFHQLSPAGVFWQEHAEFFGRYQIEFTPLPGLGGWGASTAEFISLHSLWQMRDSLWVEQERFFDLHLMLNDYRRVSGKKALGFLPSGADLVAQVRGGLTYFDGQNGKIQTFSWPFKNLKMKLIATGHKLATHDHLAQLKDFSEDGLVKAVSQCHEGLRTVDQDQFINGIKLMAAGLLELGFVASETQRILREFELPGVLVTKGCGALGADVIAIFYSQENVGSSIEAKAYELGLGILATEGSIGEGILISKVKDLASPKSFENAPSTKEIRS